MSLLLNKQGKKQIHERVVDCVEQLSEDFDNDAVVDSAMCLARGMAPDGRLYQIHVKLTFEEYDFIDDTTGAVEL